MRTELQLTEAELLCCSRQANHSSFLDANYLQNKRNVYVQVEILF